jgi:hypothetical protein
MIYAVSRQSFALGRAGYLPKVLGHVHPIRRTPDAKLLPAPAPVIGGDTRGFLAQCPFCTSRIRVPDKALGASIPCPHCSSSFTAVPS